MNMLDRVTNAIQEALDLEYPPTRAGLAAIEVMLEPTDEMLEAGDLVVIRNLEATASIDVWRSMLTAATKP